VVIGNAQTEENVIGMAEATVLWSSPRSYDLAAAQERVRQGPVAAAATAGEAVARQDHRLFGLRQDRPRKPARLFAPWGATMQYTARRDADLTGLPPMQRVDLDTLMQTSDVVVVLATLNPETRGIISAEKLR
jgi:phosphoglycerate dehydrogenase-like enzyme